MGRCLETFGAAYGVKFALLRNSGEQIAGEKMTLPQDVLAQLSQPGPRRDGPPEMGPEGRGRDDSVLHREAAGTRSAWWSRPRLARRSARWRRWNFFRPCRWKLLCRSAHARSTPRPPPAATFFSRGFQNTVRRRIICRRAAVGNRRGRCRAHFGVILVSLDPQRNKFGF